MRLSAISIGMFLAVGSAAGLASSQAAACSCPKEMLLKENGTISLFGGVKPAIPRKPIVQRRETTEGRSAIPPSSAAQPPLPDLEFIGYRPALAPDFELLLPKAP